MGAADDGVYVGDIWMDSGLIFKYVGIMYAPRVVYYIKLKEGNKNAFFGATVVRYFIYVREINKRITILFQLIKRNTRLKRQ